MVILVLLFQASQDGDAAFLVRLVDHDNLETAFKRLVFFKVLLVLVKRRGTDAAQVTTGQSRFKNVGCIHRATALAGTHQRVNLVNEQDNLTIGLGNLVDD